jgi:NAD(P)-dependent dehydrogenase (short-subunit alcohol dehydrogenase family)
VQSICEDIKRLSDGKATGIPFKADCSNEDSVKEMFKEIKTLGEIDILVRIVGYQQPSVTY